MWLGVPFPYFNEKMAYALSISKIPSISIESSFSWETIIAAFISGFVPALISFYVIKKNNDAIKYQQRQEYNRHQLGYLRVFISDYFSQANRAIEIYSSWLENKKDGSEIPPHYEHDLFHALNEWEKCRVGLLISIPDNDNGREFKGVVNNFYKYINDKLDKLEGITHSDWTSVSDKFISDSGDYLRLYLYNE